MNDITDLFGHPITEPLPMLTASGKKKRDETPRGYAAPPGSGPPGEKCRTCVHAVCRQMSKRYWKCALLRAAWTGGYGTDIRLKSPACQFWQAKART